MPSTWRNFAIVAFSSAYIQITRTFHELAFDPEDDDNTALGRRTRNRQPLQWQELLAHHRVVILSEAGSGKTQEIRQVTRVLRDEGKHAFFIRLEHVRSDIEDAFEEGDYAEFQAWVSSGEEGWLLLDSIDESRLRDPKDFEIAPYISAPLGLLMSQVDQDQKHNSLRSCRAWVFSGVVVAARMQQERFAPFCAFQKGGAGGRKGDSASPSQMDQHTIPNTNPPTFNPESKTEDTSWLTCEGP